MLREVYINLLDQKEPKLNFKNTDVASIKFKGDNVNKKGIKKVIKPSAEELKIHSNYLKSSLAKNFFN